MTQAKATAVATAIINAGYPATVFADSGGNWTVQVLSGSFNIVPSDIVNLASSQGVTGSVRDVQFQ